MKSAGIVCPKTPAASALRGRVLGHLIAGRLEIGQPGIYSATIMIDSETRILRGANSVGPEELVWGRGVLVKGIPLAEPATFRAWAIELQP